MYINNYNESCSDHTVSKYINYLEETYAISKIKPYSAKTKKELAYNFKIYDEDVSFNSIRCFDNRYDLDHNLENIVYNELLYMGYDVYVYNEEKEIDFLAQKGNKKYYIQVAYSIENEKAYDRKFAAFRKIDNDVRKVIITTDEIDYSTSIVEHINIKDFLIMNEL